MLSTSRPMGSNPVAKQKQKQNKKPRRESSMVVHAFSLSTWEAENGRSQLKASLVYREGSKITRATKRKPVSKQNKDKQQQQQQPGEVGGKVDDT